MTMRKLEAILRGFDQGVLVAYSGGVDSSLLLDAAVQILGPERAVGAIAKSETLTGSEFEKARAIAQERGWPLEVVEYSELEIDGYAANPSNRCFFCKGTMYGRLGEIRERLGFGVLCDGTNADDVSDYRPGAAAAKQHGVRSPLLEAGLGKEAIREESYRRGLPNWNKPAAACLSSRVPYGSPITRGKLDQIGQAETFLVDELGFSSARARHHGDIVRVELPPAELARAADPETRAKISRRLRDLGFAYVCLDLEGYRRGSLNEVLGSGRSEAGKALSALDLTQANADTEHFRLKLAEERRSRRDPSSFGAV
jgi:uncharacterized protein